MIETYKGRSLELGTKVKVYFNLHSHLFSLIALEGEYKGLVVAHGNGILLQGSIEFKVSQKLQQKVRNLKTRNVHAYVVGMYKGITNIRLPNKGYYNPYVTDSFVDYHTNKELKNVEMVVFADKYMTYR